MIVDGIHENIELEIKKTRHVFDFIENSFLKLLVEAKIYKGLFFSLSCYPTLDIATDFSPQPWALLENY